MAGRDEGLCEGAVVDGRFELLEVLGRGGFGAVFRARQAHLNREVAVKVLDDMPAEDREEFEMRFVREAQLAARISHPNVVTIIDFGFDPRTKQPFLAMELLSGHNLNTALAQGPLTAERVWRLVMPAVDAIAMGHRKGIIHKDIKPENLFLTNPGRTTERLKVLDYGLAGWRGHERFTQAGQFAGTPQYVAPEYMEKGRLTPAIDVYQFGLVLVEMLTGRRVVDYASPMDCLVAHMAGDLNIPASVAQGPLGPVIRKALARDVSDRYQNARELHAALHGVDPVEVGDFILYASSGEDDAMTGDPEQARHTQPIPVISEHAQSILKNLEERTTEHGVPSEVQDALAQTLLDDSPLSSADQTYESIDDRWLEPESDDETPQGGWAAPSDETEQKVIAIAAVVAVDRRSRRTYAEEEGETNVRPAPQRPRRATADRPSDASRASTAGMANASDTTQPSSHPEHSFDLESTDDDAVTTLRAVAAPSDETS